jgi:hypothetical protein
MGCAIALASSEAKAVKCVPYVSETFELSLGEVMRDGMPAEDPLQLEAIRELVDTGPEGESILLWTGLGTGLDELDKHYDLDSEITPTAGAQRHIDESNARKTRNVLCGGTPFRAIVPGVYVFSHDHEGDEGPAPLEDPVVTIAADRRPVTLEFEYDGSSWTAVYEVDAASFEADEGCGCSTDARCGGPALLLVLLGVLGRRRRRRRRRGISADWRRRVSITHDPVFRPTCHHRQRRSTRA